MFQECKAILELMLCQAMQRKFYIVCNGEVFTRNLSGYDDLRFHHDEPSGIGADILRFDRENLFTLGCIPKTTSLIFCFNYNPVNP